MITTDQKRRHIVIVDDDTVNLELADNALHDYYKLTKLISGKQLFKFLERIKPDMILLDVQMPEMSGYEVLEKINENPEWKKIPVIFITGLDSVYSEKEGFRLGAKDFIHKPFDNEIVLARINSQIELYNYRTQLEEIIEEKTNQIEDLQHVLTISWAEMIESRDGTTGSHIRNTTAYFGLLLNAVKNSPQYQNEFSEDMINDLLRASTLHDIGKIGISDTILKKPSTLTKEEFAEMQKHAQIGADMIAKIISKTYVDQFLNYARDMALLHHERWDGTGYPAGLKSTDIPLYVRILSIVDVYDALTSIRPYKKAFTHEEALLIISKDCCKFFDPAIFSILMENEALIAQITKNRPEE